MLFIAFATAALGAHAGREEVRHSADPIWRMEAFLAYALFAGLVLVPTTIYFYVFHGDWFLFYWFDAGRAPWMLGIFVVAASTGASLAGFWLGAALCRASRERLLRRVAALGFVLAVAVWPLGWSRLSVVGSYREFTRDYGLTPYFSSPAFHAGAIMLLLLVAAFLWLVLRVDSHTHERA